MRTLIAPGILDQTLDRIAALQPSDAPRWAWLHTDHHLRQFGR